MFTLIEIIKKQLSIRVKTFFFIFFRMTYKNNQKLSPKSLN